MLSVKDVNDDWVLLPEDAMAKLLSEGCTLLGLSLVEINMLRQDYVERSGSFPITRETLEEIRT